MSSATYGTGAIMAVPAHDDRDWDFAKKFGCEIIEVVKGGNVQEAAFTDCATGVMVNSGFLDGMSVEDAKKAITEYLDGEAASARRRSTSSCATGSSPASATGASRSPLSTARSAAPSRSTRSDLPLELPEVESYEPTDDGESSACHHHRLGQHHLPVLRRPRQARDGHHAPVGRLLAGTSCAIWTRTTTRRLPRPEALQVLDARSTGTTAAWSTRRSTCSTAASGTSSSMIIGVVPDEGAVLPSAPATA